MVLAYSPVLWKGRCRDVLVACIGDNVNLGLDLLQLSTPGYASRFSYQVNKPA